MRIKNISGTEQRFLPNDGPPQAVEPGVEVEVAPLVGADLVTSFPGRWELTEPPARVAKKKELSHGG